jgi:HYR domain-containing protein
VQVERYVRLGSRRQMNIDRKGVAVFRIVPLLVALVLVTLLVPAAARPDSSSCVDTDAVFYSTDTVALASRLHAFPSSCADYYLSVTPATDLLSPRAGVAPVVHANGPQFHAMPEIRLKPWAAWVQQTGNSWYEAGLEVRRRMVAAGFDIAQGDTWAINEVGTPSQTPMAKDVFNDVGSARLDLREFVRGLYTGDPGMPPAPGLVFVANPTQITSDLEQYKQGLRSWYRDGPFWSDMSQYVRFWAQETYADARSWGVPGSFLADRAAHLNDYFQHADRLAEVDPEASPAARSFLVSAYTPVANAAYTYGPPETNPDGIGFGYTKITLLQMQNFIATQTYALRSSPSAARFGFAWAPSTALPRPTPATFAALRDTLAQSIKGSESDPAGACGAALAFCDSSVDGAVFTEAWKTFTDATPPVVVPEVDGPIGANGWYVGDVTVSWNVSDPESAFTTDGCATTIVDTDTAGMTFTCTATSLGGASAPVSVTVKRDATAPVLSVPGDLAVDATSPDGATIDYAVSATDALDPDPVRSCNPPSGSVFPIGTTAVACTATDDAGNISTATFAVHVRGVDEQIGLLGNGVAAADLRPGLAKALLAKLDAAAQALANGKSTCPHLDAFVTLVRNAEGVGHLPVNLADAFAEAASRAAVVSGCV